MRRVAPGAGSGPGWLLALVLFASCAHPPPPAKKATEVMWVNTLPPLVEALESSLPRTPDGPKQALLDYEQSNAALLGPVGALGTDPGDHQLLKLAVSAEALVALLRGCEVGAKEDLDHASAVLARVLGPLPKLELGLAVFRAPTPVLRGDLEGHPVALLNARHPSFTSPDSRRAAIARELFVAWQRATYPGTGSLTPLGEQVFREGASSLAARLVAPDAPEEDALGLQTEELQQLKDRSQVLFKELAASFGSSSPVEVARFFDPAQKDPVLPREAGRFVADQLFQRIAAKLGSVEDALRLSPDQFRLQAQRALPAMARGAEF